jgi:hypothetical protein
MSHISLTQHWLKGPIFSLFLWTATHIKLFITPSNWMQLDIIFPRGNARLPNTCYITAGRDKQDSPWVNPIEPKSYKVRVWFCPADPTLSPSVFVHIPHLIRSFPRVHSSDLSWQCVFAHLPIPSYHPKPDQYYIPRF